MSIRHPSAARVLSGLLTAGLAASVLVGCSTPGTDGSTDANQPAFKAHEASGGDAPQSIPTYKRKVGENLDPILGSNDAWKPEVTLPPLGDPAVPSSLVFHDVRVGEHADFYRVVLEFKEAPTADQSMDAAENPWKANLEWVDAPVTLGKGEAMGSSGKAFLDVTVGRGAMPVTPDLEELYFAGDKTIKIGPLDVLVDGTVEDQTHVVIAMDQQRPLQAGFLTRPARLVIDVKK